MRRSASTGVVLILAASLFFGVCGPFAKSLIAAGMSAVEVTWLRVTGTGLILVVAAIPAARRMIAERRRPPLFPLIGFGLTAIAGVQLFYFLAVARLPVGVALLLEFTGPILVVAWIRWIRRVRLPHTAVAGALLSLAGLAFVVEVWAGLRLDTLGLLAGAAAAACQAGYFLAGERLTAQVGTPVLLAAGFGVGILALAPFAQPWRTDWSLLDGGVAMAGWSPPGWVVLAALVVSTASAYACGLPALRMLSAAVAGGMAYTEVVVAAVAAWILLGERLTGWQMFGGLLVVAGVFTAQRAVATREPDPVRAIGLPGSRSAIVARMPIPTTPVRRGRVRGGWSPPDDPARPVVTAIRHGAGWPGSHPPNGRARPRLARFVASPLCRQEAPLSTSIAESPGLDRSVRTTRMLALVGLWSVVASVLVIAALDAWTWNWPRSPVTRTISEYAQGPLAWPFHLAVLALAFGSLAVGTAMVRQRLAHRMSGGLLALGLWSAGLVLVVVFEKHDWSQGPSTSGYIHQLSSLTAFIALPVAGVLLARPWRGDDRWRTWARRTGGLALVSMLWFVPIVGAVFISVATDLAWWRIVPLGLAERLLTLTEVLVVLALGGWTLAAAVPEAVENTTAEN